MAYSGNRYGFSQMPNQSLAVSQCGLTICDKGHAVKTMLYAHYSAHFILEGKGTYTVNGKSYTFSWNGEKRDATQISIKNGVSLKLRWDDEEFKKHYFEFKITSNELTKDTTLIITDFANGEDHDDLINLWNEQVSILRKKLGA